MRKILIVVASLIAQNVLAEENRVETSSQVLHMFGSDKITVHITSDTTIVDSLVDYSKTKVAYNLSCAGFSSQVYNHSGEHKQNDDSYLRGYSYLFDISNDDDDPTQKNGYAMSLAWEWLSKVENAGKNVLCNTQYQGLAAFSIRPFSISISDFLPLNITFGSVPNYHLSTIKTATVPMLAPFVSGTNNSGGGGCAYESPNCEDDDHDYDYREDPLLIDLGQDGIHLGDAGVGVNFDMIGDGNETFMQWVQYGGNEAFLVQDLNDNGIIDNGMELFGTGTHMLPLELTQQWPNLDQTNVKSIQLALAAAAELAPNGFVALAQYDHPALGGNDDGYITNQDEVWSGLLLWLDDNADGISTADEMLQLNDVGITQLDIIPKKNNHQDPAGNSIPLWSWAVDENNNSHNKYKMVDVFFKVLEQ